MRELGSFGALKVMPTSLNILRIVGVIGAWVWPLLCGIAWVFRGLSSLDGGQIVLSTAQGWLCFLGPMVAFIYYLCIADMKWSRCLLVVGIIVHIAMLLVILTFVAFTDGGVLVTPLLLVGPVAWLVYAVGVGEKRYVAEPSAAPNGGPATPVGNSGATEGPPSVS